MNTRPEPLSDLEFLDQLTPEALTEALRGASREMLQEAVRQLLGMVARTGLEMIQADRGMMAAEGKLARVALLAEDWRAYARGCECMMRTVLDQQEHGRWLGCAVQASGCAEDLERVLALSNERGKDGAHMSNSARDLMVASAIVLAGSVALVGVCWVALQLLDWLLLDPNAPLRSVSER